MKKLQLYSLALLAVAISGHVGAETINVDGDLSDWGINKQTWEPNVPNAKIQYYI